MRSPSRGEPGCSDLGSATAEFAVALPAVAAVLLLCLGSMQVVGVHLRLQDAASVAARIAARGEGEGAAAATLSQLVPGASVSFFAEGSLLCARVQADASLIGAIAIPVSARGCALDGVQ